MKIFLRYLIFVKIPFFVETRIEKYLWKHASPELKEKLNEKLKKKLKELPELNHISEHTINSIDIRGGESNPLVFWFLKIVMTDLGIKIAFGGAICSSIWSETADNAAAQLVKHGSILLAVPGKRFLRLYRRVRGIDPSYSMDIKEILLDKNLTNLDKLELLKIKIRSVLKNLKEYKRQQFIFFLIVMILFSVNGNVTLFGWFIKRLGALISTNESPNTILQYVIETYREVNAPLPRELSENLPDEIIKAINNIN